MQGARNRAKSAFFAFRDANDGNYPHIAIAMEGGLEYIDTAGYSEMNGTGEASESASNGDENDDETSSPSESESTQRSNTTTTAKALFCMAWIAVYGRRTGTIVEMLCDKTKVTAYSGDRKAGYGLARSASFALPPAIAKLDVVQKMELGDADNVVFERAHEQSKRGQGTVGMLTDGIIPRAAYYEHAIVLALTQWIRPDVYPTGFV
ncbi:hypothetical protein MPSEU_000111200 [Mayamaea pseudoterrestris]|nr:hypothetical protein MPSEU_000111200 [Mayamaea pseudoterrestris]